MAARRGRAARRAARRLDAPEGVRLDVAGYDAYVAAVHASALPAGGWDHWQDQHIGLNQAHVRSRLGPAALTNATVAAVAAMMPYSLRADDTTLVYAAPPLSMALEIETVEPAADARAPSLCTCAVERPTTGATGGSRSPRSPDRRRAARSIRTAATRARARARCGPQKKNGRSAAQLFT